MALSYNPPPKGKGPSPNFTWKEVYANSGYPAMPLGPFRLPNGQTVSPRNNASKHARNLETLRARINQARSSHGLPATGITILSWARSWEHNKAVGGAGNSQHLYFLATDITREEVRRLTPWDTSAFDKLANAVFANGGFGQYPGGNRHVDSRGYRARWTSFTPGK